MVEALDIIIDDVLKEDFVKWKIKAYKNRMCLFNYRPHITILRKRRLMK